MSKTVFKLNEYKPYPFAIKEIYLDISIQSKYVEVSTLMKITPKSEIKSPLLLKGVDLELQDIFLDGSKIDEEHYSIDNNELRVNETPFREFQLKINNRINPFNNASLEGFYLSGDVLTTQCEAEGFRRITYHPDRPDVLSKYKVRIESDLKKYPVLLSNGNKVSESIVEGDASRHEVVWEDPFPKPSYLFALVAGNLQNVQDSYETLSGRKVNIHIYVESGDEEYTKHAIKSLKKAMEWDEKIYGLEYDLNRYNIVAIRHFNMGAMENKSLNIFNSKLVLADSSMATDSELERIESVIAHEYFHNWTGNRITCRDWFQLSLKEGLTVFRDQCFTADMHSPAIKRIEDVNLLRNFQFLEDSGPTSHAVKPKEYVSIDNFYTTTIYEKGAELIRMLQTCLGRQEFMRGIANYITTFDGSAATTEEFVLSVVSGAYEKEKEIDFDMDLFLAWYYQPGTPTVTIKRKWEASIGRLTLEFSQELNNEESFHKPLIIPIKFVIYDENFPVEDQLLILNRKMKEISFEGLKPHNEIPPISIFREFSAPVNWKIDQSLEELIFLTENDNDPFFRWDSCQNLMRQIILARFNSQPSSIAEESLIKSLKKLIDEFTISDPSFLSIMLTIPGLPELESLQKSIDPIGLYEARLGFKYLLGTRLSSSLTKSLSSLKSINLSWPEGKGDRRLIETIWSLLILSGNTEIRHKALQSISGNSMTLARAALNSLSQVECGERDIALQTFFDRWKSNPIVLDTWFSIQSSISRENSLEVIQELLSHKLFDPLAPNSIRAVLGGLSKNTKAFHAYDGSGYMFMAEQIIALDKRNPITASRLVKVFSKYDKYIMCNRDYMIRAIELLDKQDLSPNTREVVDLIFK